MEDTVSGLGLCIVKLTAEELGGTVSDQSRPSGGVVIRLALPASE